MVDKPKIVIGFTGTQYGMTLEQERCVFECLKLFQNQGASEFHHGDCIGSDVAAAQMAQKLGYVIVSHPPTNESKRSFFKSDVELDPAPYLQRNKDIVRASNFLLATPATAHEVLRSGTWSTIRFALKNRVGAYVFSPTGKLVL